MEQGSNGNGKADKVQDAIHTAHEELRSLLQQRAELTKRIGIHECVPAGPDGSTPSGDCA